MIQTQMFVAAAQVIAAGRVIPTAHVMVLVTPYPDVDALMTTAELVPATEMSVVVTHHRLDTVTGPVLEFVQIAIQGVIQREELVGAMHKTDVVSREGGVGSVLVVQIKPAREVARRMLVSLMKNHGRGSLGFWVWVMLWRGGSIPLLIAQELTLPMVSLTMMEMEFITRMTHQLQIAKL